jgi:hypothetical protein
LTKKSGNFKKKVDLHFSFWTFFSCPFLKIQKHFCKKRKNVIFGFLEVNAIVLYKVYDIKSLPRFFFDVLARFRPLFLTKKRVKSVAQKVGFSDYPIKYKLFNVLVNIFLRMILNTIKIGRQKKWQKVHGVCTTK